MEFTDSELSLLTDLIEGYDEQEELHRLFSVDAFEEFYAGQPENIVEYNQVVSYLRQVVFVSGNSQSLSNCNYPYTDSGI